MIVNRLADRGKKEHLFLREMLWSGERILGLLKVEYSGANRSNSQFQEAKLWIHIHDLICMWGGSK